MHLCNIFSGCTYVGMYEYVRLQVVDYIHLPPSNGIKDSETVSTSECIRLAFIQRTFQCIDTSNDHANLNAAHQTYQQRLPSHLYTMQQFGAPLVEILPRRISGNQFVYRCMLNTYIRTYTEHSLIYTQ